MVTAAAFGTAQKGLWFLFIGPFVFCDELVWDVTDDSHWSAWSLSVLARSIAFLKRQSHRWTVERDAMLSAACPTVENEWASRQVSGTRGI
jgi:hypothetical protein